MGDRCPQLVDPKHGSWYFAVQVAVGDSGHARIRRGGHPTARRAAAARRQLLSSAVEASAYVSVEQWLWRWLETLPGRVRPSALDGVGVPHPCASLPEPYLGQHLLHELRPADIEAMFARIVADHNTTDRSICAATLHRIRATLRRALNMAVRDQLLQVNPARLVILPHPLRHRPQPWTAARVAAWRYDGQHPPLAVWTPLQLAAFLRHVRGDALFALWWIAALRSLRRGELCGLRWIDLDLPEATVTVNQQIAHLHGRTYIDVPKTPAGQRSIALDAYSVIVLREQLHHQRTAYRSNRCCGGPTD